MKTCGTDMNITNDSVTQYINGFYTPLDDSLSELRAKAEDAHVPIILKETESFLGFIIRLLQPAKILEIGTAVGYSSSFFAKLGADVISVEKDETVAKQAKFNIESLGLSGKIQIFTGDGEEVIKSLSKDLCDFDMVFIDAAKSHYKRFLDASLPLCKDGAVIISDNVLLKAATASDEFDPNGRFKTNIKKMRQYLNYISEHPDLDTVVLSCGDGLALSRYRK